MKKSIFIAVLILLSCTQKPEIFTTDAGAIQGYDPVAFFKEQKPVMGKKEFSYDWSGSTWHFSTAETWKTSKLNPSHFAPQYRGLVCLVSLLVINLQPSPKPGPS
ncbi:MAG: hypothetical protein IPJ20_13640 [Flammeovirgaceae bacterium]|nr:hypothetical protein [Flammeovirgaceae bacterium]